jgi:hypothetical protein
MYKLVGRFDVWKVSLVCDGIKIMEGGMGDIFIFEIDGDGVNMAMSAVGAKFVCLTTCLTACIGNQARLFG